MPKARLPKQLVTAFTLALALALLVSCESAVSELSVTGQVVDVVPRSISEFESLTLLDESGKTWQFKGGLFTGFTPSHLQEHAALKEPVKVWYTEKNGVLTITRITDG